jgi:hypothetical protein
VSHSVSTERDHLLSAVRAQLQGQEVIDPEHGAEDGQRFVVGGDRIGVAALCARRERGDVQRHGRVLVVTRPRTGHGTGCGLRVGVTPLFVKGLGLFDRGSHHAFGVAPAARPEESHDREHTHAAEGCYAGWNWLPTALRHLLLPDTMVPRRAVREPRD